MRCGLVRLVTRRCPYDVKIRRKTWNSTQKDGETGALNEVAESKLIGRYCAHKVCRLVDKSSKLVCRVLSGNITSRKLSSTKSPLFDHLSDCDNNQVTIKCSEASARCLEKNLRSRLNLNSALSQSSKFVQRQNYSANERDVRYSGKAKPSRPYHVHSKSKCFPYKRHSAHRITSKRNINSNHKRLRNKNISKKLYVVQSPFLTYHTDPKENKYLNKLRQSSISPYDTLDKSDHGKGFLDHNVLNHLNETSYLSLCGCETCDKKLKQYEKKNNKINLMLQNKISKILNYCKKKNPFYKIYSQGDNQRTDMDMREYGMHGINGWLNYLDSYECSDWTGYKLGKHQPYPHSTKNKCVNTCDEICDKKILSTKPENSKQICEDCNSEIKAKDDNPVKENSSYINLQSSDLKETEMNKPKNQNTFQSEGKFENKDHSTTQTQDFSEPPVTNYYYITNNTLNAKCCCKEECVNENGNCSKCDNNKCKSDMKQSKDENVCQAQENNLNKQENKSDGNEKCSSTTFNALCKTMNKVYDIMIKPGNENEILREGGYNCQDNLNDEIKACNSNNFDYYDCDSYQQNHIGDIQRKADNNISSQVLNFDDFMDMKFQDMKDEKMCNKFLHYDDIQFKEIAKISSNKEFEKCVLSNGDTFVRSTKKLFSRTKKVNDCTPNKTEFEPSNCNSGVKDKELQQLDQFSHYASGSKNNNVPNGSNLIDRELGPLDHLNQFMSNNSQRYEEKAKMLSRGPNFSHFPESDWRTSLFRYDKKLSETFDVSDPCIINIPIKIDTKKTKDLSKYSEINIAIEKVKKKIHDIMNEPDENSCVGRDQLKTNQFNSRGNIPRHGMLKLNEALSNNQMESVNNANIRAKSDNVNYTDGGKKDNYSKEHNVKNCYNTREAGRYGEAAEQSNHPPSSVHLNQIIEAIKENRNTDKCDNTSATKANKGAIDCTGNKGYKVYNTSLPQSPQRKIPLINNVFIFKPGTEPIFGTVNTEKLVNKANVSKNMSTSSKYKSFLEKNENVTNTEPYKRNFMDGTIFSTDNFISEGWDNEYTRKVEKRKSYMKYMENRMKQEEKGNEAFENTIDLPTRKNNRNFTMVQYNNYQKNCQEEFFKKSLEVFSKNNVTGMERIKKSEYIPLPEIPGVINRYSVKMSNERDRNNKYESDIEKEANNRRWRIWDIKHRENEEDISHTEMISKGFGDTGTIDANCKIPKGNEFIFNERVKKTESGLHDNCTRTRVVMNNDTGSRFDRFNYRPNNLSGVDDSYCINVGDLGLNFTSFSLEKSDERENKKKRGGVERGKGGLGNSVHGSESRINNAGVTNMSMSRQADLHLRETRTVGLRPCYKNEVPHNSFRIRNSFLMDAKPTLRPVTTSNTLNKRQASSGILEGDGFKSNMSDKLKNLERIDREDYMTEEKYISNKEAIETIKVKENYVSPTNNTQGSSENKCSELGICSKEVERRTKNKAVGDSDVTKQITEEINVSGLFPEGKKTVHGKIIKVLAKSKSKIPILKSITKGSEATTTSDFKEPITVQVVYETTTDYSVDEHIEKAKRKVYIGDINKRRVRNPVKLFNNIDYKIENPKKQTEPIISNELKNQDNNNAEHDSHENKSPVWKKYDPKNSGLDSKKYYLELKKLMKNKIINLSEFSSEDKKQSEGEAKNWQAPKHEIYDKLVKQDSAENELVQEKGIKSTQDENTNEKEMDLQSIHSAINQKSTEKADIEQNTSAKEKNSIEEHENIYDDNPVSTHKIFDEVETSAKGNIADDSAKTEKDKPTSGEAKYEIDSESVEKDSDDSIENEKLVITHFKQFRRSEEINELSEKLDPNNFVLEASMLKLTLVHDKNVEIQSIESLSNEVERELNEMVSPYVKDMMISDAPREIKRMNEKDKGQLKSKEYFLNMINPKYNSHYLENKETSTDNFAEEREEPLDATKAVENDNIIPDLTNVLRSSIEEIYMKKVIHPSLLLTNDQINPAEKSPHNEGEKEGVRMNKNQTDSKTSETEEVTNKEQDAVFSQRSKGSSSKDPEIKTDELNETSEDADILEQQEQPKRAPARYDSIVKELKQMFVDGKRKSTPQNEEEVGSTEKGVNTSTNEQLSGRSSNETIEKDVKSNLETPQIENKLSEYIIDDAEGVIKQPKNVEKNTTKSLDSIIQENIRTQTTMPPDIMPKIEDTKKEINTDDKIMAKTKSKAKSAYKSYESKIKPKIFGKRKYLENMTKGRQAIFKKEYEMKNKSKIPIAKPKPPRAPYKSFYSYDSFTKPSVHKEEKHEVGGDSKTIEADDKNKTKIDKQEETKFDRGDHVAKEFAARSETLVEKEFEGSHEIKSTTPKEHLAKVDKQEETKFDSGDYLATEFAEGSRMLVEKELEDSHEIKSTIPKEQLKSSIPDIEDNRSLKTNQEEVSNKDHEKQVFLADDTDLIQNPYVVQEAKLTEEAIQDKANEELQAVISKIESMEDMFAKPSSDTDIKDETEIAESTKVLSEIMPSLPEIKTKTKPLKDEEIKTSKLKAATKVQSKQQKATKVQSKAQVEPPEEEFEIMSSSFTQYEEKEREVKRGDAAQDRMPYYDKAQIKEKKDKTIGTMKFEKKRVAPIEEAKQLMPKEREKAEQELKAWEKEPTYLKNLRPAFYKIKHVEVRQKNYEDNEKKFADMKLLNKISSMNKVSGCTCKRGEKWVADMCCSLEDEKENKKQASEVVGESLNAEESEKNQQDKGKVVQSGKGQRSADWPDNLSRKKDAVIKQPLTPRPPWRN